MKRKKPVRKSRPVNEITEEEVREFLAAISNFDGYPRLRELGRLLPSMNAYKINVILCYLERSKTIIIDNEGYITWIKKDKQEDLTLADVADIDERLKEMFTRDNDDN